MIGSLLLWVAAALITAVAAVLAVAILAHNFRVWCARQSYRRLPEDVRKQVLHLIKEAATHLPAVNFLRLAVEANCDDLAHLVQSHVGGVPYAEATDQWPADSQFLLQVRLSDPSLGERWVGRLIVVFLVLEFEQPVRSYVGPTVDKYVPLVCPGAPAPCVPLTVIRMPVREQDDDDPGGRFPASLSQLLRKVPTLSEMLRKHTNDPQGLLAQILHPNIYGYDLEESDLAFEGGEPMLIQGPHDPLCEECCKPMRFLFQFGEIIPGKQLADGGVGYVYGCDQHPDRCKGHIDSH